MSISSTDQIVAAKLSKYYRTMETIQQKNSLPEQAQRLSHSKEPDPTDSGIFSRVEVAFHNNLVNGDYYDDPAESRDIQVVLCAPRMQHSARRWIMSIRRSALISSLAKPKHCANDWNP